MSVKKLDDAALERGTLTAEQVDAFELAIGTQGSIDSLHYREIARRKPRAGEVEVRIRAAALNFKDVLKVMGMLPAKALEHTFHGNELGMEGVGVITQVGEGVENYRVGDSIVASIPGCLSSHVTVPVESLFAAPQPDFSPVEAASVPVVFMTAYYALHDVARLSRGEKVLIHAATGGVGLAAIQVARWLGAEIFATAGSPEKRDFLRRLGVQHIFDSRNLDFADGILSATGGRGVDVVLNSLPGESFLKSLSVLAPFGRFLEIGKRDIVENSRLPLLPFNRNLSFAAIDLDQMMVDKPELIRKTLNAVLDRLRTGDFAPVPTRVFRAGEIADAFRYMAQAKQIGKIVVDFDDVSGLPVISRRATGTNIQPDATYLITGGFGGFGLEVAKWLAQNGARHLALVGRRGPSKGNAQGVLEELRRQGVEVMALAADVSQEPDVERLLADIARSMPPLRGVFHAAGVLDDGFLSNLDGARMEKVMAPKAMGAWLLHRHTQHLPLENFVLFSSMSAWIGNPGQGNYVAANAVLESLAQHRRAVGLAATSISWGALAEVGMFAENQQATSQLSLVGIRGLSIASATNALSHVLAWDPATIGVMDVEWNRWRQVYPIADRCPRFSPVAAESEDAANPGSVDIRTTLLGVPENERVERLATAMAEVVAETLRMGVDKVNIHQPLSEIGIDSLAGVELQLVINSKLGIEVSILELMKAESIINLARRLLDKMNISELIAGLKEPAAAPLSGQLVTRG
jgi:NADPH:quinone reductase-like Zn-dependent oxidoreductase/acyl carrier protein